MTSESPQVKAARLPVISLPPPTPIILIIRPARVVSIGSRRPRRNKYRAIRFRLLSASGRDVGGAGGGGRSERSSSQDGRKSICRSRMYQTSERKIMRSSDFVPCTLARQNDNGAACARARKERTKVTLCDSALSLQIMRGDAHKRPAARRTRIFTKGKPRNARFTSRKKREKKNKTV